MINVSSRLLAIASLVSSGDKIVDIGCDHGLLDIYLTLNKSCKCVCYDVDKHIIDRAISNISKYNLLDKIEVLVGNGFSNLNISNDDVIVLAGMGTTTILKILEKNKSDKIICQTNTDLYDLRKNVCDMGYYILDENIVFDNNRYYVTIKFDLGNRNYSYDDYLLGPILRLSSSHLFKDYVRSLYNKNIKGYNKAIEFSADKLTDFSIFMETLKKYI